MGDGIATEAQDPMGGVAIAIEAGVGISIAIMAGVRVSIGTEE